MSRYRFGIDLAAARVGRLGALFASFGFLAITGFTSWNDGPAAWTSAEWSRWRDGEIHSFFTPVGEKMEFPREVVIARCVNAYTSLAPFLGQPGFLQAHPELQNFAQFVSAQARMARIDADGHNTHRLGFAISDREYWSESAAELQLPPLLRDQEFLKAVASPAGYREAIRKIDAQNATLPVDRKWVTMLYRSRFLMSADGTTYGRLLILIPNAPTREGDFVDRWTQFAIKVPDGSEPRRSDKAVQSISMVAVRKDPLGKEPSRAFVADFMRDFDRQNDRVEPHPTMLNGQPLSKNCYECHKSPVLPIHPKTVYGFDPTGALIESSDARLPEELNKRIRAYGKCELAHMDTPAYGPSLGAPATVDFIRTANAGRNLSMASVERIQQSMNCSRCHDAFAKLNYPLSVPGNPGEISFESKKDLVQTYIEQGWMPPKNDLDPNERIALWNAVRKQYLDLHGQSGLLIDWLRGYE